VGNVPTCAQVARALRAHYGRIVDAVLPRETDRAGVEDALGRVVEARILPPEIAADVVEDVTATRARATDERAE